MSDAPSVAGDKPPPWLKGDVGALLAAGCAPALGAPTMWPASFRNAVGLILGSAFPMFLVWGPERRIVYNDAYRSILGARHPDALGLPFWSVWPEVRAQIEPVIESAFAGEDRFFADLEVPLVRHGRSEPAWFTFSYSPVYDADGGAPGVLCVCMETTRSMQNAQQLKVLDEIGLAVAPLSDADQIMAATTRIVGEHLGVSICAYADMDDDEDGFTIRGDWSAPGSASIVGRYRLADFGRLAVTNLSQGRPLIIDDNASEIAPEEAATFQAIGIRATICMPLVKEGRLRALMAIHHAAPHHWTDAELALIREVTERSWAHVQRVGSEAELRASEELLRLATDAAEIGLWDVDLANDALFWPARVRAMFGISSDRPVSLASDFLPNIHPEDRERVGRAFAAAIDPSRRAIFDEEYRTIGKEDGALRWVAAKGRGVFDEDGACSRVLGTAIEITARKNAERRAAEQAHSLRVLNSTGAALAAELDLQKVVQLVTDAGVDITGAQFGAFFYNLINDAGESYMLYALSGVDRSKFETFPMPRNTAIFSPTFKGEGVVRSADITRDPRYGRNSPHRGMPEGHLPVRSYLAVPVVARSGEVIGGLFFGHAEPGRFDEQAERLMQGLAGQAAVAIDNARLYQSVQRELEQRRSAEEQLRDLNETLEQKVEERTRERDRIFRLSTDLFAVAGFDGYLRAINPAWTELLGYGEQELLSRPFIELVHPDDQAAAADLIAQLAEGRATGFEDRLLRADGSVATIAWTAVPEGDVFYAVGRDVTEAREREEQLRHSQKMEAIGQLTGGIAHDFNNLLTGIIGSLDLMQSRLRRGQTGEVERFAAAAMTSANRAAALTHRLLAFSRRQPIDPKVVDANDLIASMEDLVRRTIGETISLEVVADARLWMTRCDPNQLESALLNLAINARDAMPHGGKLTIETCNADLGGADAAHSRDVKPGQYVCIAVSDTGAGMAADVVSRAFDPFFTTKPIGQGTGLGLSMVYGFARQADGYARIQSEPGRGATIRLYLPRSQGVADADEGAQAGPAEPPATEAGEVVLVVEDERAVRDLVTEVLLDLGYEVLAAPDGPAGLALLQRPGRIDLLVTDVGLPGMNGRQVADAARSLRPGLKVLFMTGYAENAANGGFLEEGMALITKPFAVQALAARIRAMIE